MTNMGQAQIRLCAWGCAARPDPGRPRAANRNSELVAKCVDSNVDCGLIGRGSCRAI
jgi:hypothetical protein